MSASADYGAKIVESFAPKKNWLPGEEVNKDVYVTNTGDIGAFVGMDVSGTLSVKNEVAFPIPTTTTETLVSYTVSYNDGTDKTATVLVADVDDYLDVTDLKYYPSGDKAASGTSYACTITENKTSTTSINDDVFDCVELTKEERYAVEAGAYLAYLPDGDKINKVGDQVVVFDKDNTGGTKSYVYTAYKDASHTQLVTSDSKLTVADNPNNDATVAGSEAAMTATYDGMITIDGKTYFVKKNVEPTELTSTGNDFTPHANGLYVFRRSIDVDAAGFGDPAVGKGAESFTYDGYLYYGGRYYKITDLTVTPDDEMDVAGDKIHTDGNLTSASANLVKEVTAYADPVNLEYDNANNRLIATYGTKLTGLDTALTAASKKVDEAEHEYAAAELALRRAIDDAATEDAAVKEKTSLRDQALKARDEAQRAYDKAKAEFEALKKRYQEALVEFQGADGSSGARGAVANDIGGDGTADNKGLVGSGSIKIDAYNSSDPKSLAERAHATNPEAKSYAKVYDEAVNAYDTFVGSHTLDISNPSGTVEKIEHIYFTYLKELNEEFAAYTIDSTLSSNSTKEALEAEIKKAVEAIGYNDLSGWAPDTTHATHVQEDVHTYHQLLTAKELATKNYEDALQQYLDDVAELNNVIDILNQEGTNGTLTTVNTTTDQTKTGINGLTATDGKLYDALKDARAAYDGKTGNDVLSDSEGTGGKAGDLADAEAALLEAEKNLKDATNNVTGNDDVKQSLEDAWERYYKAKNALEAAKKAKDDAQKKYDNNEVLTIYINLDNDVLVGGVGDKWQILPTSVENNVAHFYYTSIVEGGHTTEKLIDSVELAGFVTQDMYKYFDFDLNVAMKSAKVTYDDAGNVLATAVNKNGTFNGELDADVVIADPAHEATTALTWTAKP